MGTSREEGLDPEVLNRAAMTCTTVPLESTICPNYPSRILGLAFGLGTDFRCRKPFVQIRLQGFARSQAE
jgi:hypothetical protein